MDSGLVGTRVVRMKSISLSNLLNESAKIHHNINFSHLNLQILRIITPKNGSNTATMKYHRGGFSQNITYICIIMYWHYENICYIMINNDHNRRFFIEIYYFKITERLLSSLLLGLLHRIRLFNKYKELL